MKVRTAEKILTNSLLVYIPSLKDLGQIKAEYKIEKYGKILLRIKNNPRLHYNDRQHRQAIKLIKKVVGKRL